VARPLELRRTSGGGGRKTLFTFRPGHAGSRGGGDSMSIKGSGPGLCRIRHNDFYGSQPLLFRSSQS